MTNSFGAAGPMLGYLFQIRQALLLSIELSKSAPSLTISVERMDDIAVEDENRPLQQLQLKHHIKPAELSDTSVDLWKTLRVWSVQTKENPQLPFETQLIVLSTGVAPVGSAASHLREGRTEADVDKALDLLRAAASSSANVVTAVSRNAFQVLTPPEQRALVRSIRVFDQAPNITDVRSEIEEKLAFAGPSGHIQTLVDHLEGWWFDRMVRALISSQEQSISVIAVRAKIDEIAAAFRQNHLLINPDVEHDPQQTVLASDHRIFVKQLNCVEATTGAIDRAKRDYYRASTQRSEWARENALLDGESAKYDRTLIDQWQRECDAAGEDADLASEEGKRKFGRAVFHWADRFQWPFRNRHESWLAAGSLHMLADRVTIGWHPDFRTLFREEE